MDVVVCVCLVESHGKLTEAMRSVQEGQPLHWNNSWDLNKSYVTFPACRTQLTMIQLLVEVHGKSS